MYIIKKYNELTLQQLKAKENVSINIINQYINNRNVSLSYATRHIERLILIQNEYNNR